MLAYSVTGTHTHTSVENHLGMSRSDCAGGLEDVDLTLGGHNKKKKTEPWLHDLDLQRAATKAELIHLIYVLLWALRGPAAEKLSTEAANMDDRSSWAAVRWDGTKGPTLTTLTADPVSSSLFSPRCVWRLRILIHPLSYLLYPYPMIWWFSEQNIKSGYTTKCCDLLSW